MGIRNEYLYFGTVLLIKGLSSGQVCGLAVIRIHPYLPFICLLYFLFRLKAIQAEKYPVVKVKKPPGRPRADANIADPDGENSTVADDSMQGNEDDDEEEEEEEEDDDDDDDDDDGEGGGDGAQSSEESEEEEVLETLTTS